MKCKAFAAKWRSVEVSNVCAKLKADLKEVVPGLNMKALRKAEIFKAEWLLC